MIITWNTRVNSSTATLASGPPPPPTTTIPSVQILPYYSLTLQNKDGCPACFRYGFLNSIDLSYNLRWVQVRTILFKGRKRQVFCKMKSLQEKLIKDLRATRVSWVAFVFVSSLDPGNVISLLKHLIILLVLIPYPLFSSYCFITKNKFYL